MNKFTKVIIPLALAFASTAAMAEDGSDYVLSSVPEARAPSLVPQMPHQDPGFVVETVLSATTEEAEKADNQHMSSSMMMTGDMSEMREMMKDCRQMMDTMKTQQAAG